MIWRVLRKNISVGQILGYGVANFIGLAIVLSAVRFYGDVNSAVGNSDDDSSIISKDYLVLSSPVSMISNAVTSSERGFSADDIEELRQQPWLLDLGEFSSAEFNVSVYMDLGNQSFSSYLFLEAIPDRFIDIKPDGWEFDPAEGTATEVPIILSKDYLALYNFGFAATRGLPQLSESSAGAAPLYLRLSGNGHSDVYKARIVGFSSRLNTIAVPETFLQWANERYSSEEATDPSRLILKVKNPGDPAIKQYLESRDYEVAGDKVDSGKASYFLTLLTTIVIAIGAIISALALFILMLSIFLLLQKNRDKITDLLLLGYSPGQVSAGYYRLIGIVNAVVLALSIAAMLVASHAWEKKLAELDMEPCSPVGAIAAGVAIMAVITAVNFIAIRRAVRKNF